MANWKETSLPRLATRGYRMDAPVLWEIVEM